MDTTELGVSILLKSWSWCLVAVLTACILEQWISLAFLGCFFVINYSQRSSRYFSLMLPRFNTKDKNNCFHHRIYQTKQNPNQTNKKKKEKKSHSSAPCSDSRYNFKILWAPWQRVSEASSWLSCVPNMNWYLNQPEFLCCLNCHVS